MADRLTSLACTDVTGSASNGTFSPRSVSLDIRSPEELEAVNQFLLTLGRDVTSVQESRSSSNNNNQPYSHYFDYGELSQLGLTGMPGISMSNTTTNNQNNYSNPSSQYSSHTPFYAPNASVRVGQQHASSSSYGGSIYPSMSGLSNQSLPSATSIERRMSNGTFAPPPFQAVGYQQPSPLGHTHLTPPVDSSSPHSSLSSPSNSTPPHMRHTDSIYERSSRPLPPAVLAPVDYTTKAMHKSVQLKSIPGRSPSPDDSEDSSSSSTLGPSSLALPPPSSRLARPLYPLFTSGNDDLKLPPLQKGYPGLSPPSSPTHNQITMPVLPSLREVAANAGSPAPTSGVDERLSRRLDSLKLNGRNNDSRARHAALIRDLLVTINERYRTRFTPAPPRPSPSPILRDAEIPVVRS
jgi:hypothetical protein